MLDTFEDVAKTFEKVTPELERLLSPEDRDAVLKDRLAPTYASLEFQPESLAKAVATATRQLDEERAALAGEHVYTLQELAKIIGAELPPLLATADAAPSPGAAWFRATNKSPTDEQRLQLDILNETRWARFDREGATASPATVAAQYAAALRDPHDQLHASYISWVEATHGGATGWTGRPLTKPEADALMGDGGLRAAIRAAKDVRRPNAAVAAVAALAAAEALVTRADGARVGWSRVEKRATAAWRKLVA